MKSRNDLNFELKVIQINEALLRSEEKNIVGKYVRFILDKTDKQR